MAKIHKKQPTERTCYELAVERMEFLFDRFDKIAVAFSGGKDSTACMNIALDVARARGRLPLDVYTFDEEAIPPQTVEYMDRITRNPEINFKWYCLEVEHRNACSRKSPNWYCWDSEKRDVWCRDLPPQAITELAGFRRGMDTIKAQTKIYGPQHGTVCHVMGIRTQESLTRYTSIASKAGFDCFYNDNIDAKWQSKAYPIYDWNLNDVWEAPKQFGWDYNRAYDLMEQAGLSRNDARCSPPYGEQPIRRLHSYRVCWPELWAKMIDRVPGAATAARYANTELYGYRLDADDLVCESWKEQTQLAIERLEPKAQRDVAKTILSKLREHRKYYIAKNIKPIRPVPDAEPDVHSGQCWKFLYQIAAVGGDKLGRQGQKNFAQAKKARAKFQEQGLSPTVRL